MLQQRLLALLIALLMAGCSSLSDPRQCGVELFVLGAGQDAGAPQIGYHDDPAWRNDRLRLLPTSLAIVEYADNKFTLFEATPAIGEQLQWLHQMTDYAIGVDNIAGIVLTHAHIGHYAGLMYLGREAANASAVPVFALPRMTAFIADNAPWSQLVTIKNIKQTSLTAGRLTAITDLVAVTAIKVPHRDEYSETAGYRISVNGFDVLFLPDIDEWQAWRDSGFDIAEIAADMDLVFIDATFFDDDELPGRDMSKIPHPRVTDSMAILAGLPMEQRRKIHFIHYNHTNPIRFVDSTESAVVLSAGFSIARRGDRHCLD
ncbi:MAG: MBL fold metallo-hydrolase [Pseudomonadota bacterium]